ncbi:MAG: hypothetical protein ACRDH2_08320 [Anaerolineales bacterium]
MLSPSDLLRLPYEHTLTLAGIEYAKKSLHYTYNRMRLDTATRLRKIVGGVAVELAFQHWLDANGVPYDRLGMTAFTEKDKYDLRLGGRRCDLKSFLISAPTKIAELRRDPAWLLDADALVPLDQFEGRSLEENDFYLFGFLAGRETRRSDELQKAIRAEQPAYLLYTLDDANWLGVKTWRSLGRLALKSNARRPIEVEVGGQDEKRAAIVERLPLEPRARVETAHEFFSLLYLHVPRLPGGALGVHSPALKETRVIAPREWANIWVYGLDIYLAGWLSKAEFRARSRKLPAGSPVKQYVRTQTDNRALPVRDLRPIAELAALVKNSEWGRR